MRPTSAHGFKLTPQGSSRISKLGALTPGMGRPISARQGYSRPVSYNNAFKATNTALQRASSRDLTTQVCSEIGEIIAGCTDDCDALDGLITALTAKTTEARSKIERLIICQSLCAIASRLRKLSGTMWPKILRYINKELRLGHVFEVDSHYMTHLANVYGAYTKYVLELTDITVLISLLEELIDKMPTSNKAVGFMALSRIVEEMHSRALFIPMEHGLQLSEYICQLGQKLKKGPDDRALLEASSLLHTIVQISPEILTVPPTARKVIAFVTDCHKHKNWKIREKSLQIIECKELLDSLPSALAGAVLKVAEECRYDRIEAVRTVARSILGLFKVEQVKPRTRSAIITSIRSSKPRPKSTVIRQPFLDRPSNNNTLISWVDAHDKSSSTVNTRYDYSAQPRKAYTYVPITNIITDALPFRQSRGSGLALSSTSSTLTDTTVSSGHGNSCNKTHDLLKLVEGSYTHLNSSSVSDTESDHSPKVQTAIYCKKLSSATNSSSDYT